MMSAGQKSLKEVFRPLFLLCWISGIGCFTKPSRITKVYLAVLIIFNIWSYLYLSVSSFQHRTSIHNILDQAAVILLTLGCITSLIRTNFFTKLNSSTFFVSLDFFDSYINVDFSKEKAFCLTFVILERLEILTVICSDICSWFFLMKHDLRYYFGRNIQLMQFDTVRILIQCILFELRSRFKILNRYLQATFAGIGKIKDTKGIIPKEQTQYLLKAVRKVCRLQNILCDLTEVVNMSYGLSILFDVMLSIAFLLEFSFIMIRSFVDSNHDSSFGAIAIYVMWCAEFSVSTTCCSI